MRLGATKSSVETLRVIYAHLLTSGACKLNCFFPKSLGFQYELYDLTGCAMSTFRLSHVVANSLEFVCSVSLSVCQSTAFGNRNCWYVLSPRLRVGRHPPVSLLLTCSGAPPAASECTQFSSPLESLQLNRRSAAREYGTTELTEEAEETLL